MVEDSKLILIELGFLFCGDCNDVFCAEGDGGGCDEAGKKGNQDNLHMDIMKFESYNMECYSLLSDLRGTSLVFISVVGSWCREWNDE